MSYESQKSEIKQHLIDYVEEITEKSKHGGKNQYICPLCHSGTGRNHSGAFTVYPDNNSYHCFACGESGDIFKLYGLMNNTNDFKAIVRELQNKYNIVPLQPMQSIKKKDYTKFCSIAEQHLHETDYLTKRGISIAAQRKFHCGYVANFMYKGNQTTPAVIIPTSNTSFMWRSTIGDIKQKRGTVHILNPSALKNEYCFVVEGEIDCLSVDECGFACIGLGSTNNINKIFDFNTSAVLILALDNDKRGHKATVKLAKMCDDHRVPYIIALSDIWSDCKDANELLVKDRTRLITSLQEHSDRAVALDKKQWFKDMLERKQANSDWRGSLIRNQSNNAVKNTLVNLETIFLNDPKYKDKIEFNEFTQMRTFEHQEWQDVTENRIKLYLEKEYSLTTSIESINQICSIIADDHSCHPIKQYFNSIQWDGIHRIRSVFTDFLGATDNLYTQSVAIVTFTGAVARILNAGVKFDTCTTFVGKQGTGKSKFLYKIAVNPEWFTDSITTFDGKDFYESIQGKWIVELGEGTAFQKSIKERCKQAIASQQDTYREAYARHTKIRKRQCVFFGTTNNYDFLKDETGNRRYYPIDVNIAKATKNIDQDLTPDYVNQLWAEAVQLYKSGQSIYIQDSQILALAEQEQRKHFDESPLQSDIANFLDIPLPKPEKWYSLNLDSRRHYIQAYQNDDDTYKFLKLSAYYKRDKVSVKEIMCELYGYEPNQPIERKMSLDVARTLTSLSWNKTGKAERIPPYGVVKVFHK